LGIRPATQQSAGWEWQHISALHQLERTAFMARPVTLFTGQWADLPLEEICKKVSEWGYDGLELACWGDHFEVDKALSDDTYCARKRELLEKYDLQLFAISNHLAGQCLNRDGLHTAAAGL
jgi:hypothetical protein